MIDVVFYKFQKKPNSTARPSSGGTTLSCSLIENTNILAPKIRVHAPINFLAEQYNYIYISAFSRYYFINDPVWELGTWTYSCRCDVLATYKNEIGASSQYVRRSSYTFDGTITDTLYPIKNAYSQEVIVESTDTLFCPVSSMTPYYVVGIIEGMSDETEAYYRNSYNVNPEYIYNGSVVYYVLDSAQLMELMKMLLGSDSIYGIPPEEISSALTKQLINPIQYIESIRVVPFKPRCIYDSVNQADARVKKVQIGFSLLDVPGTSGDEPEPEPSPTPEEELEGEPEVGGTTPQAVANEGWRILARPVAGVSLRDKATGEGWIQAHSFTMRLPVHPQSGDRGVWVQGKPTSSYTIEVEPFGMIDIPGNVPVKADKFTINQVDYFYIKFNTWFDVVTGKLKLHLSYEDTQGNFHLFYNETTEASMILPCHQSIQDASSYFRAWTSLDARKLTYQTQAVSSLFGSGIQGSTGYSSMGNHNPVEMNRIGVGTGLVSGIMNSANVITNYYHAEKPQMELSMLEANMPQISGAGGSGGSYIEFAWDFCAPRVHCYFCIIADDNNPDNGRPLCQIRQLSTLPGFIQCEDAHFVSYGTADENMAIMQAMNGGFYYE